MTTKYGSAFAHSLPSHMLSRVMGVVVAGMAPVVVHFGGKKKRERQVVEHDVCDVLESSSSSVAPADADDTPLGSLPSFLPRGIEMPSIGYALQISEAQLLMCSAWHHNSPTGFVLSGHNGICLSAALPYRCTFTRAHCMIDVSARHQVHSDLTRCRRQPCPHVLLHCVEERTYRRPGIASAPLSSSIGTTTAAGLPVSRHTAQQVCSML